jgi:type IV pilus assembly protein PilB
MNSPASTPPLSGLARRLVADNLLDGALAGKAVAQAKKDNISFVQHLVANGVLGARTIAFVASEEFGTPLFDLDALSKDAIPQKLVDDKLIRKHQILPISKRGNRLFVAVTDPTDLHALDEIKFNTGTNVEPILVESDKLKNLIEKYLNSQEETLGDALGGLDDDLDDLDVQAVDDGGVKDDSSTDADEAPVVKFINKVLLDAIKGGASDIHFEPYEKSYRIRFRTDGVLHEVSKPPVALAFRMAARLKVMSQMDISERRLRILDPSSAKLGIDALGYEDNQKKLYLDALAQSQGMILVTGPTGSGKTVSLYTGLNILNTSETNISTAEDPVEINLEGINQVQMNNKVGLNFAEALRSFLRQDPDIVMVGEIRDLETAEIAIKAAQTGHLVLSTLHTNSAPETLTRLMNMGVPAFNIATSVSLIIAQRLARRLCSVCKKPATDIPPDILTQEGFDETGIPRAEFQLFHPVGCDKCNGGYKGRVGVYEVVRITPKIANLIMEGGNSLQIAREAKAAGFNNLRTSALRRVAMGLTSLEEANRVTKD